MTAPNSLILDPAFAELKRYIVDTTGLAYFTQRDTDLAERVQRRLQATNQSDCQAYLALLRHPERGDAENDNLVAELTIGETHFFRYTEQFDALRDLVIPDILQRQRHSRRLRVWSAGCATGPEPYSVSILMHRDLATQLNGWDTSIKGTDINRAFLARADRGEFPAWALRGVTEDVRQACFTRAGETWTIQPRYREGVHFQYHNLVRHPFPSAVDDLWAFDLIMCRNVLIYFDVPTFRRLLRQFEQSLTSGGWLLVGHAEPNVELFRDFRTVSVPGATLYQKSSEPTTAWEAPIVSTAPPPLPENTVPPPDTLDSVWSQLDRGHWNEAERLCRQLLAIDELNPMAHFAMALAQEQQGHIEAAETMLRRALYLDREFIRAHYHLGLLQARQHNHPAASRSFRNVLHLLANTDADRTFPHSEGLTARGLQELASMQLEVLESA